MGIGAFVTAVVTTTSLSLCLSVCLSLSLSLSLSPPTFGAPPSGDTLPQPRFVAVKTMGITALELRRKMLAFLTGKVMCRGRDKRDARLKCRSWQQWHILQCGWRKGEALLDSITLTSLSKGKKGREESFEIFSLSSFMCGREGEGKKRSSRSLFDGAHKNLLLQSSLPPTLARNFVDEE